MFAGFEKKCDLLPWMQIMPSGLTWGNSTIPSRNYQHEYAIKKIHKRMVLRII